MQRSSNTQPIMKTKINRNRHRNDTDDKLADKDIKTGCLNITIFYMFKKVEERLNTLRRGMDGIKKI